jgi:hypothetical protein
MTLRNSGLLQAQTNGGRRPALRAVGRTSARAKHRHQRLARIAAQRIITLYGADVRGRRIALVPFGSLLTWSALRTLRSLRASLTLSARDTLDTLRSLGTGGTLWPWVAFGSRIFAASG